MPITLGTNIPSLRAQQQLARGTDALTQTYSRLSSGQRINKASDDAAGLAISEQLNSSARVFSQAIRNVNDGISVVAIAEGALNSLQAISQRQLELAEQAANGTYSLKQRQALDNEANKLVDEFNRIVEGTSFNGLSLLDPNVGAIFIQAGYGSAGALAINLSESLRRAVGDGTFSIGVTLSGGNNYAIAAADFNGDGKSDLISAAGADSTFLIFLSNGDGSFQAAKTITHDDHADSFRVGDFNGDGKQDVAAVSFYSDRVNIYLGNGDGTFSNLGSYFAGVEAYNLTSGDFNQDGDIDLITANYYGSGQILIGNGDGTFRLGGTVGTAGQPLSISTADLNDDGKLDVISGTTGEGIVIAFGNGDGSFNAGVSNISGIFSARDFESADINSDGITDLIVGSDLARVTVLLGNGDGTLRVVGTYSVGHTGYDLVMGDFNGDGQADFASANYGTNAGTIFLGNGDGTFRLSQTLLVGGATRAVSLGDFTGDGRVDIAFAQLNEGGIGVFSSASAYSSKSQYLNINTQQGAREALDTVAATLARINSQVSSLGAISSRFQSEISNLSTQRENYLAAAGRIKDADTAADAADLVKRKIVQQTAAQVLSQANISQELALILLRK